MTGATKEAVAGMDCAAEIASEIERYCRSDAIGVAVSGGGDSMALLAVAAEARCDVRAVTVDHGLRTSAAEEARSVGRFCGSAGIAHDVVSLSPSLAAGGNLSARARTARYSALADWAGANGIASVLLGHTLDDQAETVLMRLGRGSGVDGLAAMAPVRDWLGVRWVRPMLGVRRADLRNLLRGRGIAWSEDPTNDDPGYDRVKARHALALLGPLGISAERLAETAVRMTAERAVLEDAAAAGAGHILSDGAFGEVWLDPVALADIRPATGWRLLGNLLTRLSGAAYRPRARALVRLAAGLSAPGFAGATLAGCVVEPAGDRIVICREPAAQPIVEGGPSSDWDAGWRVTGAQGYRIGPLGRAGLAEAARLGRAGGLTPWPGWDEAPQSVRVAVPSVRDASGALICVPSAGLVFAQDVPPIAARPRPVVAALRQVACESSRIAP